LGFRVKILQSAQISAAIRPGAGAPARGRDNEGVGFIRGLGNET
jgi:hypothetical protein